MMFWEFCNYVLRIRTKISSPDNHATLLIIGRKSQSKLQNIFHELYIDTLFYFYKNIVFPGQAEYSYSSADFRL